jgi:hypothetical protein
MKAVPVSSSTVKSSWRYMDVFGEEGLRAYIVGHLEGLDDAMEGLEEEEGT